MVDDKKLMEDFIMISKSEYIALLRYQNMLDTISDFVRRGGCSLESDLRLILGMEDKTDE